MERCGEYDEVRDWGWYLGCLSTPPAGGKGLHRKQVLRYIQEARKF